MAIQKADANTTNPVDLTAQDIDDIKAKLALNNVENTADANKIVSNPTQTALNNKVDKVTGKGLSTNDFTDADETKLVNTETSNQLTARDTANRLRGNHSGFQLADTISDFDSAVSLNTDVIANTAKNSYPTTDENKLSNIEANATADQTDAEIKTAYESNADTNAFTDANQQKLSDAVESDTTSITGAGQVVNLVSITQANYDSLTPDNQTVYIITDA